MSIDLATSYDPAAVQSEIADLWVGGKCFHAEPTDPGEPYAIAIPPPNVTAALHLGHALNNTLQDILVRRARMQGRNAVWLPGTDHAGIATQTVVEKRVLKEQGKRRIDFDRDEFVRKIQEWKDEYEQVILGQLKAMGCSCDWDRTAFTMDDARARAVREAFFRLFKSGLIYRGKRLVNWDPVTQTALADDEVENEEIDGSFYYLRYPLCDANGQPVSVDGRDHVTVATTRPETMLGDTAVAINPRDPRAPALRGKSVKLPIVNRVVPIIEDDYVVMPASISGDSDDPKAEFATGFLKVTPAHDPNDWDIGQRHRLPAINIMAPDASISLDFGWRAIEPAQADNTDLAPLLGLSREAARKEVVAIFERRGLLQEIRPYRHSVGHSYRSHVPIEPYLSDQWYCRVTDPRLAQRAIAAMHPAQRTPPVSSSNEANACANQLEPSPEVANGSSSGANPSSGRASRSATEAKPWLTFFPERYARTFQTWHENIRDWCISRQLWWGHRIPIWSANHDLGDGIQTVFAPGTTADSIAPLEITLRFPGSNIPECTIIRQVGRDDVGEVRYYLCVPPDREDVEALLERHGFVRDPDVLDTWFSSALWPLSTLGWPDSQAIVDPRSALNVWNPTTVLCTAREIITLWVSRMVMFNLFFLDRLPFFDVFIHAMIQDGEGRKMSKSLGNGVDPLDIIRSHGADAMRFTLASMATNTQDVRMPVERDPKTGTNTSPKFDLGRNFCNKLWNAARFVLMSIDNVPVEPIDELKWTVADSWIVSRFNRAVQEADDALGNYRFDQYARCCYDFFWRDFCDWYVECAKAQLKDPQQRGQTAAVLAATLDGALRLLHPVTPFITEKLWSALNETRPQRGLPGRIDCPTPSDGARFEHVIRAPWPGVGDVLQAAEFIFPKLQEIITAIRTVRSDYKVDPKRQVTVSIRVAGDAARQIELMKPQIELLSASRLSAVGAEVPAPASCAKATAAGCEVFVEGLVDESAEQQRLAKRRDELTRQIEAMKKRLANEGYLSKAPPALVQQTKDQLTAAEAELARLAD